MSPTTSYCTILATNYLPRAMALADSLARHHPGSTLVVLFIDVAHDEDLPALDGIRAVSTSILGLSDRALLDVAASYDLVEFATAVKPLLLGALLDETDQVVYLDPDTFVTAPMEELDGALAASEGGIVLTPHYLEELPGGTHSSEGHLLTVGVYNLGFCAVDRRSRPMLDWWWGHLKDECLFDILSGLFVDQKWMDVGSTLFRAAALRHYGYNVGVVNIHERMIAADDDGYVVAANGDRLRLFHFHAFDSSSPDELSTRSDESTAHLRKDNPAVDQLCNEYAEILRRHERALPPAPAYPYLSDTRDRPISRQVRRVYRRHLRSATPDLPSPFVPADADRYDRWRRSIRKELAKDFAGEVAKAFRCVLPDQAADLQRRFPRLSSRVRSGVIDKSGIWG